MGDSRASIAASDKVHEYSLTIYTYTQSARFMTENTGEETRKNYTELENTLEMIELELQASQTKLSFPDNE